MIAGFPAVELRAVMRELRSYAMSARILTKHLGVQEAASVIAGLESAGLIEPRPRGAGGSFGIEDDEDWRDVTLYRTTIAGNALAKARIGKPMKRQRAEELLSGLLDRVRAENDSQDGLFWIERVGVFGSFADVSKAEVGDVDVHIVYSHRYDHDEHRERNWDLIREACEQGRTGPSSIIEELFWADDRMFKRLRSRQSRLDIQFDRDGAEKSLPEGAMVVEVYRRAVSERV